MSAVIADGTEDEEPSCPLCRDSGQIWQQYPAEHWWGWTYDWRYVGPCDCPAYLTGVEKAALSRLRERVLAGQVAL